MKATFIFLFFLLVISVPGYSQQPSNAGFDIWTSVLNPDGWVSLENLIGSPVNIFTYQDAADKVSGVSSLKLIVDTVPGSPQYGSIAGQITYGTGTFSAAGPSYSGVAFAARPDTLIFDYKRTSPAGVDSGYIDLVMSKNTLPVIGFHNPLPDRSVWTHVELPITGMYLNGATPDTMRLQIGAANGANGTGVMGTTLHVDNLRFGYAALATGLPAEIKQSNDVRVYPNPATNNLTLELNEVLNEKAVLQVFALNGQLIEEMNIPALQRKTSVSVVDLQSGSYLLKIVSGQTVFNKIIAVVK